VSHRIAHAGQVGETDCDTIFGLKGRVARLEEVIVPARWLSRRHGGRSVTNFKPDGNRIGHTRYDALGRFLSRYEFTYDEQGRRAGPLFYKGAEDRLDHQVRFTYGADGRRRAFQEQFAADGALMFTLHFVYDAEGRRMEQRWVGPDGAVMRTYHVGYDAAGNRTKQSSVDGRGQTEWRSRARFDEQGRVTRQYRRDGVAGLSVEWFRYADEDEIGNWTRGVRWRVWLVRRVVPFVVRERLERRITYFGRS
jgi:hypothetical protein